MKTRYLAPSLLMASLIGLASPVATASDQFAGALIGAGAGAVIGHAVGGHDGAVVGGFLGAALGASAADDHATVVHYRPQPYVIYGPPVRYYAPPPYWSGPRHIHHYHQWRHDRHDWRHDRRDEWRDRDGWHDGRGPEGPWHYRSR